MRTMEYSAFLLSVICALSISTQAPVQAQTQSKDQQRQLAYGLVIDNSGSLRAQLNQIVEVGKLIVNSNKSGDEAFLVRFVSHDNIRTVQDFTTSRADLINALDNMFIEGGTSAIIDAVYFSAQHISQSNKPLANNNTLILISDGDENGSFYKLDTLLKLLREKNVKVYVIGFVQEVNPHSIRSQTRAMNFLNKLATESGGRAYYPNTLPEATNIAARLLGEIRRQ